MLLSMHERHLAVLDSNSSMERRCHGLPAGIVGLSAGIRSLNLTHLHGFGTGFCNGCEQRPARLTLYGSNSNLYSS